MDNYSKKKMSKRKGVGGKKEMRLGGKKKKMKKRRWRESEKCKINIPFYL